MAAGPMPSSGAEWPVAGRAGRGLHYDYGALRATVALLLPDEDGVGGRSEFGEAEEL
jgi:hypothetical protein